MMLKALDNRAQSQKALYTESWGLRMGGMLTGASNPMAHGPPAA